MRIITRKFLEEVKKTHPKARAPLDHWHRITRAAKWQNLAQTRETFAHADQVTVKSNRTVTVFNITNDFRLITAIRSEEHTSEPQSPCNLVCRLLLEKKNSPGVRRLGLPTGRPIRRVDPTVRPSVGRADRPRDYRDRRPRSCLQPGGRFFFFLMIRRPPKSALFPNTTLFR